MNEMDGFKLIKQGAEAKLYVGTYLGKPAIAKERFQKTYRHPELDSTLTKERIKAESRAISRCRNVGIRTPTLYLVDFARKTIFMEHVASSITAKDFIAKSGSCTLEKLSWNIGRVVGKMHANNIIHGDLTTSNILLANKNKEENFSSYEVLEENFSSYEDLNLVLIDFGLAHISSSAEDKGVDLYVLERALLSTHSVAEQMFGDILKAYQGEYKNCKDVVKRYEDVKARGRKRTMVG